MQAEKSSYNPHEVGGPTTHTYINGLARNNNMLLNAYMASMSMHNSSDCGQQRLQQQDNVDQKVVDIEQQHLLKHRHSHGTDIMNDDNDHHHLRRHLNDQELNIQTSDYDHGVVRRSVISTTSGDHNYQYCYNMKLRSGVQYAPAPPVHVPGPGSGPVLAPGTCHSTTMDELLELAAAADHHEMDHAGMDIINPKTVDDVESALLNDSSNPPVIADYSSRANMPELSAERDHRRFQQLCLHPGISPRGDIVGANYDTPDPNLVGRPQLLMSLDSSYGSSLSIGHDHQQQDQSQQLQQLKFFYGTDHNHPSPYLDEKNAFPSNKQHILTELNAMFPRPSHVNVMQGSSSVRVSKVEASPDSGSLVHVSKLGHLEASAAHDSGSNTYTTMAATVTDTPAATDCWSTSMTLHAGRIQKGAGPPDILSCADAAYSPLVDQKELLYRAAALRPLNLLTQEEIMLSRPKQRKNVRISKDPQSMAARHRRQRISDKMRMLQRLVPGGMKMDTASMLEEAVHYLKFLKAEVEKMEAIESSLVCHQQAAASAAGAQVGKLGSGRCCSSLIKQHHLLNLAGSAGTMTRVHQLKKRQQQQAQYCAELATQDCVSLTPSHSYTSSSSGSPAPIQNNNNTTVFS